MDANAEDILRRLHDRDAEMCVLFQRACLMNGRTRRVAAAVDHDYYSGTDQAPATEELGSKGALEKRIAVMYGCQEKVGSFIIQKIAVDHGAHGVCIFTFPYIMYVCVGE